MGQTSNPSSAWKGRFRINGDDDYQMYRILSIHELIKNIQVYIPNFGI